MVPERAYRTPRRGRPATGFVAVAQWGLTARLPRWGVVSRAPDLARPDRRAWASGRIVGVDIARWCALMGMVATHTLRPLRLDGEGITVVQAVAGGRASALFAVLAGVSMALLSGGREPLTGTARRAASRGLAVRAGLIAAWGLLLGQLGTSIAIILTYYGVLFLLGLPFLGMRTRTLLLLAGAWAVVAPVVSFWLRPHLPPRLNTSPVLEDLEHPLLLANQLLFTGVYPAFSWLAYLLLGLAIGRTALDRRDTAVRLLGLGAALAAASYAVAQVLLDRPGVRDELAETLPPLMNRGGLEQTLAWGFLGVTPTDSVWWLAVVSPHSGTPLDLLHTGGCAAAVIGAALLLARLAPRPLAVVFGAGAMTLSLYSLHVVLRREGWLDGLDATTFWMHVVLLSVIGAAYRWAERQGPLERLVAVVAGYARGPRAGARGPREGG